MRCVSEPLMLQQSAFVVQVKSGNHATLPYEYLINLITEVKP